MRPTLEQRVKEEVDMLTLVKALRVPVLTYVEMTLNQKSFQIPGSDWNWILSAAESKLSQEKTQ